MYGVIIALVPALLVSFFYFGIGSAVVCAASVAACVFFEWAISKYIMKRQPSISDGSAILTGLLLGFNLPSNLPIWIIIIGALVAIGIGKMIGFTYPENFNYPYISKSITEFWRRWHITLSSFFKDYVYIPLGGNRVSSIRHIINILIVWTLTGFWHGANYNFIIWGLYYGIILLLEKYILKHIKCNDVIKHIYTIIIIMIGWVIFSIDDSTKLIEYLRSMFLINTPFINKYFLYYFKNYFFILIIGIWFSTPIINKIQKVEEKINKKYLVIFRILIYLVLFIITVSYLVNDSYNPFLYFRF